MQFQKATRRAVKLKLAVQGPSGSGKTLGALALAHGLAQGQPIAVIDTENGSASLYADRFSFDVLELRPPYETARYLEAIKAAHEGGYAVVVIDSLSHQWVGEGSILSRKETDDQRPGSNSYTNWGKYTKEHEGFKAGILNAPIHIVATLRSKQDYVLETNEKGKQQPRKIGMAPIQRDGMEYEFTTVWEVQMDHRAAASKDRTGLFEGQLVDLVKGDAPKRLLKWLETAEPAERPVTAPKLAYVNADGEPIMPFGKTSKGKALTDVDTVTLQAALDHARAKGEHPEFVEHASSEIARRAARESEIKNQPFNEKPIALGAD